jgi:parallel beta-helix repeat protein
VNNSFKGEGYAWAAIDISGNNMLLEGNVCDIKGNTVGTQGHCFYISQGTNIIIRNNVVRGMTGYGIHVFDQRRSKDETYERLMKDIIIEGNVASNSVERAGIILAAYDHARIENVIIRNNIVFNNPMTGIYIPGEVKNVKIYNNTIFGNHSTPVILDGPPDDVSNVVIKNNIIDLTRTDGGAQAKKHAYVDVENPTVTLENNLYWPGPPKFTKTSDRSPVTGDPRFVNPAAGDFHLQRGSAAIDKGTAVPEVPEDKESVRRPQGQAFDIGAYEVH